MKTVTREDLTTAILEVAFTTKGETRAVIDQALEEMAAALVRGDMAKISNFASFSPRRKRARLGRNPKKPEQEVVIEPRTVVVFKPSLELRAQLKRKRKI